MCFAEDVEGGGGVAEPGARHGAEPLRAGDPSEAAREEAAARTLRRKTALVQAGELLLELSTWMRGFGDALLDAEEDTVEEVQEARASAVTALRTGDGGDGDKADDPLSDIGIMRTLDACGAAACPDRGVELDAFQRLSALRDVYLADKETELGAWREWCTVRSIDADARLGGWDEMTHLRYEKVLKEVAARGKGQDRAQLLRRLAIELPEVPGPAIDLHDDWFKARRLHVTRLQDVEERHRRQWRESTESITAAFAKATAEASAAEVAAAQAADREREQGAKHAKLSVLRQRQMRAEEEAAERAALMAAVEAEIAALEAKKVQAQEIAKKNRLEEWRLEERERKLQQELSSAVSAAEQALVQEQLRAVNKERVAVRDAMLVDKAELRKLEEQRAEEEEALRIKRLEAIAHSVPYRERLDDIAPDPERTRSHTVASETAAAIGISHAEFLANDGDVRALVGSGDKSDLAVDRLSTRGYFVTDGYNNKQIFSNMQFKLGLALREAGLHGSDAARQAMMSLAQPRQGSIQLG